MSSYAHPYLCRCEICLPPVSYQHYLSPQAYQTYQTYQTPSSYPQPATSSYDDYPSRAYRQHRGNSLGTYERSVSPSEEDEEDRKEKVNCKWTCDKCDKKNEKDVDRCPCTPKVEFAPETSGKTKREPLNITLSIQPGAHVVINAPKEDEDEEDEEEDEDEEEEESDGSEEIEWVENDQGWEDKQGEDEIDKRGYVHVDFENVVSRG